MNSERRHGAPEAGGEEFLIFNVGQEQYCIDILKVQEIRGYDSVTRVANAPAFIKGIVVDGVSAAQTLTAEQIRPAPGFNSTLNTDFITGIGTIDDRMLILTDIEKLMTSEEMALMESATA
ncbi:chemotaxis protein CheW [Caballeronia sp. AZ7_KS35]|uniref:chemotaxis protein CheW n=1 Tax=Caballeronia sp. AZ7_KS35 TaxID=2921762 RepID=UPI00202795B2|nr:chemotaxis protein CheW [Caballeronia sp. AZ7_KS35]